MTTLQELQSELKGILTPTQILAIANLKSSESGLLLSKTVTLTNAQIKALPTTKVEIVAAPGAGKQIVLLGGLLKVDTTAGAYTNVDGTNSIMTLIYNDGLAYYPLSASMFFTELNDDAIRYSNLYGALNPDGSDPTAFLVQQYYHDNYINNLPVAIGLANALGDLTGGDNLNSMKITMLYAILEV